MTFVEAVSLSSSSSRNVALVTRSPEARPLMVSVSSRSASESSCGCRSKPASPRRFPAGIVSSKSSTAAKPTTPERRLPRTRTVTVVSADRSASSVASTTT